METIEIIFQALADDFLGTYLILAGLALGVAVVIFALVMGWKFFLKGPWMYE
jgi:hypothetical protein